MKRSLAPIPIAVLLALGLTIGLAIGVPALAQSDTPATQTIDTPGVRGLDISGPAAVTITAGAPEQIVITAAQADLDRMRVDLDDDEVDISFDRGLFRDKEPSGPITIDIGVATLEDLELDGAVAATITGTAGTPLDIDVQGASSLSVAGLTASSLELDASGASRIEISGSVDTQDVDLSETSTYDGTQLSSRFTSVEASDASHAIIRTEGSLQVEARDASLVEYIAPPGAAVTVEQHGASKVNALPYAPLPAATPTV